ncbi:ABC transporter ATP-binding protein [Paenibacillus sp. YIM B09110]|uniref:ABC transporter ATP-binding protein n=1 Tax=Paenibacillus sp. YIM B09110 TaxID=3126102 RepID=UPI00301CCBE3
MQYVIELDNVRKLYGRKVAIHGLSLQVKKGEIFGIVGPNGAGKTTLIEIIEGLRKADSGTATVLGRNIRTEASAVKQRIGVLLQSTAIPQKAKVKEVFELFASFYDNRIDLKKINTFLELEDKQNAYIKSLSGGWKQRVSLALALINDPEIVFLDEPSMGLDPNARKEMWAMIHRLRSEGRTIVVTTHYMEEAEHLCDRIAVIDKGRIIALDTPRQLIAKIGGTRTIQFKNNGFAEVQKLQALPFITHVEITDPLIKLQTNDIDQTLKHLYAYAAEGDWLISELKLEDASMNDVFNQLTATEKETAS